MLNQAAYVDEVLGLATTIKRDGVKLTGVYKSGELVPVDFDAFDSLVLLLQNGKVSRQTLDNPFVACSYSIKESYNLSVILYKQGYEDINCRSMAQDVAWQISMALTGVHPQLMAETGFDVVSMQVKNVSLDSAGIYEALFSGDSKLTENDTLIEINFEVETTGEEQCYVAYPCAANVQGDADANTAFGTDAENNDELINGNL